MNELIILMGTSGAGKSSVARALSKKGYVTLCFDDVIKAYDKPYNQLSEAELKDAYEMFGKLANSALKVDDVVVDEWFYLDNSYDWFSSQIEGYDEDKVHFFELEADLETILERNAHKRSPAPPDVVKSHYDLTRTKRGTYYVKYRPIVIHTEHLPVSLVAEAVLAHLNLKEYINNHEKLKDQPIDS
ncbi:MAG: AAA family ATPase [Nanoarchaeota archaeon]